MALYPVHNERHTVHGIFKRRISEKNILRRKGDPVRKKGAGAQLSIYFLLVEENISRIKRRLLKLVVAFLNKIYSMGKNY